MQSLPQSENKERPRLAVATSKKAAQQETQEEHEIEEMQDTLPLPSMSEFADEMISEPGLGPELAIVAEQAFSFSEFGFDNKSAAALSATLFWQSFIESPAFPAYLQRLGASPLALHASQKIVVCHGEPGKQRLDLMIFDPGCSQEVKNSVSHVKVNPSDLRQGWNNFITPHHPALAPAPPTSEQPQSELPSDFPLETEDLFTVLAQHMPAIAIEVSKENSFGMILVPQPQIHYTADLSQCDETRPYTPSPKILLPNTAIGIADCKYGDPAASIGMFTTNHEGKFGFTTALHATKGESTVVFFDDTLPCLILEEKPILDTCFAMMPFDDEIAFRKHIASRVSVATTSPLSKRTPSIGETGTFNGISSSTKTTEVCGWDWELPLGVNPNSQLKVYTRPDTIPGDSGAALVSDLSNAILGFASYRSKNIMAYSAWMWAEAVFMAFQVDWDQMSWEQQERERVEKEKKDMEQREREWEAKERLRKGFEKPIFS